MRQVFICLSRRRFRGLKLLSGPTQIHSFYEFPSIKYFFQQIRCSSSLLPKPSPPSTYVKPGVLPTFPDWKKMKQIKIGKYEKEIEALKYEKTPLTEEDLVHKDREGRWFAQILMKPVPSDLVLKKEALKLPTTNLAEYFEIYPRNEKSYNTFIRGLGELGMYEEAKKAIEDMKLHGLTPNIHIYTSLMTACVTNKDPDEAFRIYERIKSEKLTPTVYTYDNLVEACVEAGQLDRAYTVLDLMKKEGIEPNQVVFTSLIKGCLRDKDVDRAWQTFDHMKVWTNLWPDQVQYTLMIIACAMREEAERAHMLYQEMKQFNLYPTEVTFNALLMAYAKRKDFYDDAFKTLAEMKASGYSPDLVTFILLLKTCARGGDARTAELIFDEIMNIPGAAEQENPYSLLIQAYSVAHRADFSKVNENIQRGEAIWQRMLAKGIKPTTFSMNHYLSLYSEALRLNRALEIKDKFKDYGLVPDQYCYNSLIKMFMRARRPERALDMYTYMIAAGVQPNFTTYSYLVETCAKTKWITTGMKFLREMKDKGYKLHWSHEFVLNFRRNCTKFPHIVREIDELTGKAYQTIPSWKKPGGRKPISIRREITKEELEKEKLAPDRKSVV